MLLDRRLNQQAAADEHRAGLQEAHAWLEKMSRGVESLEAGSGRSVADRLNAVETLASEHTTESSDMLTTTRERADALAREVSLVWKPKYVCNLSKTVFVRH